MEMELYEERGYTHSNDCISIKTNQNRMKIIIANWIKPNSVVFIGLFEYKLLWLSLNFKKDSNKMKKKSNKKFKEKFHCVIFFINVVFYFYFQSCEFSFVQLNRNRLSDN